MAVTAVLYGLVEVPMTYLRALERPGLFLLVSLGRLALGVALNVALVVVLHWGVMGVVWANALSSLATALALAAFTVPRTGLRVSPRVLKGMLWFGVPFVPSSLAMLVVHNGDRYILAAFRPLHEIGIYSLGYKLGMILTYAIAVPFTNVWTTRMYTVVREPGGRAAYARVCRYFVYTLLFAWVGLAVCAPELVALAASREFVAAAWFVPVIAGAYVLREVAECWKNAFLIEKRTRTLAWLQPLMAAVNLVLTYVLVRGVGTHGAAWATLWTFVLMVVLTVWLAEDLMPTPVDWGRLAIAAGAAVVIFLLGLAVPPLPLPVSLPVKVALALLFPLALVGFHAVPPDERRIAAELLARARARGNGMRR
jgi:O-antigen/teichoic acid export membrane protein